MRSETSTEPVSVILHYDPKNPEMADQLAVTLTSVFNQTVLVKEILVSVKPDIRNRFSRLNQCHAC
jgi:hypothetical protein